MVVLILMELDWYFKEGRKFQKQLLVSSRIKREPILDICTIKQKSHKLFVGLALVLYKMNMRGWQNDGLQGTETK